MYASPPKQWLHPYSEESLQNKWLLGETTSHQHFLSGCLGFQEVIIQSRHHKFVAGPTWCGHKLLLTIGHASNVSWIVAHRP